MGISHVKVKRPAVFLDRDGTIIAQEDDIVSYSEIRILPGAIKALAKLKELGFLLIVVTNQPVVGKGMISEAGIRAIHSKLNAKFAAHHAKIDAFYVCPHRYYDHCNCRKPKQLLIKRAQKKFSVDMKKSFFVGDDLRDVETGRIATLKTILVRTGNGRKKSKFFNTTPDMTAQNLLSAVKKIEKII